MRHHSISFPWETPFITPTSLLLTGGNVIDMQRFMRVTDPSVKFQAPLPHYLSTNSNVFGESEGPLTLKTTVEIKQARFPLHSRMQVSFACMMCLSTPVSLNDWIEGEQFYINCSHHSFKLKRIHCHDEYFLRSA